MGPATQGVDKGRNAKIAAFPLLTPRLISRMPSRPDPGSSLVFPDPRLRSRCSEFSELRIQGLALRDSTFAMQGFALRDSTFAMLDARLLGCLQHLARRSWQACLLQLSCTCGPTFAACEQLRAWSDLRCCAVFECDLVREVSLSASHSPLPSALLTRRLPVRSPWTPQAFEYL